MFEAPYCWCCGKKEDKHDKGCKEYYKLKGAKSTDKFLAQSKRRKQDENRSVTRL